MRPVDLASELATQRDLTDWFIAADPTEIELTPRQRVNKPGGGVEMVDLPSREPQVFKMIPQGLAAGPLGEYDQRRQSDYVLLGRWDAQVEVGDHFADPSGQTYEVTQLLPYNGYEVKASVQSYGRRPDHG